MEAESSQGRKIVSHLIFFIVVGIIALWTFNRVSRIIHGALLAHAAPEKRFMVAWDDDIKRLDRSHALHQGFKDLKKIDLFTPSQKLKDAFKKYPLHFNESQNGKYSLEIFADDIEGGGVVIQYDLVENKSGNTIWELGRTFPHNINR